ncbi:MAG: hypothetical protein KBS85_02725 [Lachnospiraceae bacterium]|nr:hypothetical protein [Candidatus Merdinaster equi]
MKLKFYLRGLGIGIIVTAVLMGVATSGNNQMTDEEVKKRAVELGMVDDTSTLTQGYGTVTFTPTESDHPNIIVPTEGISSLGPATTLQLTPAAITQTADDTENIPTSDPVGEATIEPTEAAQMTEVPMVTEKPTQAPTEVPKVTEKPTQAPTEVPKVTEKPTPVPTEAPKVTEVPKITDTPTPEPTKAPSQGSSSYNVEVRKGDSSGSVCKRMEQAGIIESAKDFDKYLCKMGYDTHLAFGEHTITSDMTYEQMAKALMGKQ